jgi:hypothetical protein
MGLTHSVARLMTLYPDELGTGGRLSLGRRAGMRRQVTAPGSGRGRTTGGAPLPSSS